MSEKKLKRRDFLKSSSVIIGGAWLCDPLFLFPDVRQGPAADTRPRARAGSAPPGPLTEKRIEQLIRAFEADGFAADRGSDVIIYDGGGNERIGIRAHSRTAANYQSAEKKTVY